MKKIILVAAIVLVTGATTLIVWQYKQNPSRESLQAINFPQVKQQDVVILGDGDSFNLVASMVKKNINGREFKMLAYNGSIPGPLIKGTKGSTITVNFTNNTDQETTIHSHGVRLDNQFDGVPDVTQAPVKVGKTFAYKIKFPDEGLYWYHPHLREDYAQELGLYGNFLVLSDDPQYWSSVNQEWVVFLDDILIEDGTIVPFDADQANHTLMGRFGNVMLVNGETSYQWKAKRGEVVRIYVTNAANTRPFNFTIPGAQMKLVGGDNGKYERETLVDSVMLGPSERAIIEVLFNKDGTYPVEHQMPDKTYVLGQVVIADEQAPESFAASFATLRTNSDVIQSIDPFRPYFDREPDKQLKLTIAMKSPMGTSGGNQHMMHGGMVMDNAMMQMGDPKPIEWEDDMGTMNRNSTVDTLEWRLTDQATTKSNLNIADWQFKQGEVVKIRIFNDPSSMHPMQHPIHIHGQRFLVLTTNGVPSGNLVWKDTALVKTGDTVDLLVEMANPGTWMAHCHISEHLAAGMMMKFEVK